MSEKLVIEKSTLEGIADAVRSKSGTSDLIMVSALANAISNIPSGGGGDLPDNIIIGEFTPQENLTEMSIDYSKDKEPIFAACFLSEIPSGNKNYLHEASVGLKIDENIRSTMAFYGYSGSAGSFVINYASVTEMSNEKVTFATRGGSYTMKAGITYNYIIAF